MDPLGVAAIVGVLVVATTFGLWRRRTDGLIRDEAAERKKRAAIYAAAGLEILERPEPATPAEAATAASKVAASAASTATAAAVQIAQQGAKLTVVPDRAEEPGVVAGDPSAAGTRLGAAMLERLGVEPAPVTLLQFSSAFCAPCRAVRRVSAEVSALLPAVRHVEVDAESHLDEVRELGIWRTPTLLILDADGRVVKRATGVPSKPQLVAAVADLLPAKTDGA